MKVKSYIEIDRHEYIYLCLDATMIRLRMARRNFAFMRKTLFPGEKSIPFEQEIVFARLYEKIGRNNYGVRSLKKLRAEYLNEVRGIWGDYYQITSRCVSDGSICEMAERQALEYLNKVEKMRCALGLFEKYLNVNFVRWPDEISEFISAIQQRDFSAFYTLFEKSGMNWWNMNAYGRRRHPILLAFKKAKYK